MPFYFSLLKNKNKKRRTKKNIYIYVIIIMTQKRTNLNSLDNFSSNDFFLSKKLFKVNDYKNTVNVHCQGVKSQSPIDGPYEAS